MILALLLLFVCGPYAAGQDNRSTLLSDFVGRWNVDKEKTYSKSVRKQVDNYSIQISLDRQKLTIYWDYTIQTSRGSAHSYYHTNYVLDGKEQDLRHDRTDSDAWAQTTSFDGKQIKCRYNYGVDQKRAGSYLDFKTFSFSPDKKYLIVESVFRSADRFTPNETEPRKLYFLRTS
jgi:hypothetical protein